MKTHCERHDLQQGRFADSAILTAIQQWNRPAAVVKEPGRNGIAQFHKAPRRKAANK